MHKGAESDTALIYFTYENYSELLRYLSKLASSITYHMFGRAAETAGQAKRGYEP